MLTWLLLGGGIAVVIGVIALLTDGLFDLPDSEWFSATGLAAGVAIFCFTAAILVGSGTPFEVAAIPAAIAALLVMAAITWLLVKLRHATSTHEFSVASMIGHTGTVITPIVPGALGEIDLVIGGERHRMNATAATGIATGGRAEVVEIVSPTCVRVVELR